ncbi:MAG TPA: thioesterase family protein [Gammaproteobacteria bacterium]|jgi:acyl-CoA thioester hydrolase|nr:thioesterase family protein [Gammaproteobacteria bacterium]
MHSLIHTYPVLIQETFLDTFGHMNNAMYLTLLEEARWDLLTAGGFTLDNIHSGGIGPVILDIKIRFLKEIRVRDRIIITTQVVSYEKKIGLIAHKMMRGEELCCTAEVMIGLWDLKERKLIPPTPEWMRAIGIQ